MNEKIVKLLKLALRAGTPSEANAARFRAMKLCMEHAVDYDALLAQAAAELAAENPEQAARDKAQGAPKRQERAQKARSWSEAPRQEWSARTKYDPASMASRRMLADALKATLKTAGFAHCANTKTDEEVWSKVVGCGPKGDVVVKVYTSIVNGATRGKGTDAIRVCSPGLISSKSRGGRKGHTVRRCGRFGNASEGRDHRHANNPGIMGRLYREILNVQDAALRAADAQAAPEQETTRETDREFLARIMRDYAPDLAEMPHPARFRADKGDTMADYLAWLLQDELNRYDRKGNDRYKFARERVEDLMG